MTRKELARKTVAELRELASGYGHRLAARVKSGIVDELADVIQRASKDVKARARKTSDETAKTVRAVKKAVAAGRKAAAATRAGISKKKAAGTAKTSVKPATKKATKTTQPKKKTAAPQKAVKAKSLAKPSMKKASGSAVLELKKKDLQGKTVAGLKDIARSLGLKQHYANKEEFVTALAKDLAKLRAEAKKKAAKPVVKTTAKATAKPAEKKAAKTAAKKTAKPAAKKTAKPASKKTVSEKKTPAVKAKAQPEKPKARKAAKPSESGEGRMARVVKPAVHTLVEKARELAAQVREKMAPSIKPAKPKVAKKKNAVSGKKELHGISMPHIAAVVPQEESTMPPIELLAAVAVEPTELFVSWVLDPRRSLSGHLVLRVLEEEGGYFDTPVDGLSGSTYIRVLPGRHYQASAGMVDANGVFTVFRRSNLVTTPPGDVQPLGKKGKGEHPKLPEKFYTFTPQEYGSQ